MTVIRIKNMFITILVFILILGLLVFVHELGHFITAKKNGVKVEEFGFGFPPRIFGVQKGETIYSINLIPLGGFVKIYGQDGADKDDSLSFTAKKIWQRATILVAGIAMNFLLAITLLSFSHMIGLPTVASDEDISSGKANVQITEVSQDSPAQKGGIQIGDIVKRVNGQEVQGVESFQNLVKGNLGKNMDMVVLRGSEEVSLIVTPRENPPEGEGAIGVGLIETVIKRYPWYSAFWEGLKSAYYSTLMSVIGLATMLQGLLMGGRVSGDVAGPVGIAVLTGQVTKLGFVYILNFTAILSLNLAIINAIPFPALDGGRLLFLLIEKIKGSPVSQKVEQIVHGTGFALLILLMIIITVRDIGRFF